MPFNAAAVQSVFDAIVSAAETCAAFESVHAHEPKSAPTLGQLTFAVWLEDLEAVPAASGLAAVSGRVTFMARVYRSYLGKDEDKIDPGLLTAVSSFLGQVSGGFTLGGVVRNVDLLGEHGPALNAKAAYLEQDGKPHRVTDITIPVIVNDMWTEAP